MSLLDTRLRDALKAALDARFGTMSGADDTNRSNALLDFATAICDEVNTYGSGGGGGGGAPTTASYVTLTSDAGLSNETLFSALIQYGTLASRPAASTNGRLYYVTDSGSERLTRDNGTTWADLDLNWSRVLNKSVVNSEVSASAGIVESKLALNFATHSNANDPSSGEKAALAGTSGAPGSGNKYVTDSDSRLTDDRDPTAHAASHASAGSDPITIAQSQVTNLVSDLTAIAGAAGLSEVDFGSGGYDASVAITGQTNILAASSIVHAWLYPKDTASHSTDEHLVESIDVAAHTIVDGVGFTIRAKARNKDKLYGVWSVAWRWV